MTQLASPSREHLIERIKHWPTQPGVYLMRDVANRILYVGKAKNLKNRIRSYFQEPQSIAPKTRLLVRKIHELEFTVTNTELEALLLECNLIKKHRPRYNIRLKDDKNYPYVVLDFTHPFPQFRISRKVAPSSHLKYFGPYSGSVNEISRFLLKTFQVRDCSDSKFKNRTRPCLNYEIGTCTGPCVGLVDENAYAKQIQEAILFLKGKKQQLLHELRKQMLEASNHLEFERAKTLRDKIAAVRKITEKQSAVWTERQRDIDVVGCHVGDNCVQIIVLFIRGGFLTGRRAEKIPLVLDSVEETIRGFLELFYTFSLIPDEIWVANDFPDRLTLERLLAQRAGKEAQIRVRRSEKSLRLLGMAYENAKLIYEEGMKKNGVSSSAELGKVLSLAEPPQTIEGIDVSNIQGTNPAVALVHFSDERPLKSRYRIYYPKMVVGQNDFAMIYETVLRRFQDPELSPPDLLMIDGGKGQLASAVKALSELRLDLPLCSLAKARTEGGFTRKEVNRSEERIFLPNRKDPVILKEGHPALRLLQQVRDEAHRFSVKSHQVRRRKEALEASPLLEIKGIGEKTRSLLLRHFRTFEAIRNASLADLLDAGLTRRQAEAVVQATNLLRNEVS